jgi:peptidoglycan L-alanyl-D-glutamate endopeptidase CwlK
MSHYGPASLEKLMTCHEELVSVCSLVIPVFDHAIICGRRGEMAQNEAFSIGMSNARWLESNHNSIPPALSEAVDIAPWHATKPHIRWDADLEFAYLAGHMMQAAAALGVKLRCGGDWDKDHDLYDRNRPFDLGHFERC